MNNDNKVETAIAELNCWASYATVYAYIFSDIRKIRHFNELGREFKRRDKYQYTMNTLSTNRPVLSR